MNRRLSRLLLVGGLMLAAAESRAQSLDPAAADSLFREGRRAADQGDFETACPKFEASLRIDPAPGTLFNLAHCEEKLGRIARAWTHYREVIPQLPTEGDDRRPYAEQHAAELEPRVARLTLRTTHPDPATAVLRDDVLLDPAAFDTPLPLDAGPHVIIVKLAGHADTRVEIVLGEGESREIRIQVGPALPPARRAQPSQAGVRHGPDSGSRGAWLPSARQTGWALVGLGAAGAALGGVAGILTLRQKSIYDDNCSRTFACNAAGRDAAATGTTWGTVSTASFVIGATALGAGAIVLFADAIRARPAKKGPAPTARLAVGF